MQPSRKYKNPLIESVDPLVDAVRLVVRVRDGSSRREPCGSAFIVAHGRRRLIVTAAHVVEGPEPKFICITDDGGSTWPKSGFRIVSRDPSQCDPDIAIAVATLTAENSERFSNVIPSDIVSGQAILHPRATFVVVGNPISAARMVNGQSQVRGETSFFKCAHAPLSTYEALRLDPDRQLALRYSRTEKTDESGKPIFGRSPTGMSGGPIFAFSESELGGGNSVEPHLVGVITHYYPDPHSVFVGSGVDCIQEVFSRSIDGVRRQFAAVDV